MNGSVLQFSDLQVSGGASMMEDSTRKTGCMADVHTLRCHRKLPCSICGKKSLGHGVHVFSAFSENDAWPEMHLPALPTVPMLCALVHLAKRNRPEIVDSFVSLGCFLNSGLGYLAVLRLTSCVMQVFFSA